MLTFKLGSVELAAIKTGTGPYSYAVSIPVENALQVGANSIAVSKSGYDSATITADYAGTTVTDSLGLQAAIDAAAPGDTILVDEQIGDDENFTIYNITKPVTIKGSDNGEPVIYGTFHVYTNGVSFDKLEIRNKGGYNDGTQAQKATIDVLAKQVSITNCDFIMGVEVPDGYVANGVTIWPIGDGDFDLVMSGNTFTGYDAETDSWSSTAVQIVENIDIVTTRFTKAVEIYGDSPRAGTITTTVGQLQTIAEANEYDQCSNDFVYRDWDGDQYKFVYATNEEALSNGLVYAEDGATIVLGDNITFSADDTLKAGVTLIVPAGKTLTIASGATVTGTITGDGDWTGKIPG